MMMIGCRSVPSNDVHVFDAFRRRFLRPQNVPTGRRRHGDGNDVVNVIGERDGHDVVDVGRRRAAETTAKRHLKKSFLNLTLKTTTSQQL